MSEGKFQIVFYLGFEAGHFKFEHTFVDYSLLLKSTVSFIDFKYVIFSASIIACVSNGSLIFICWKIYPRYAFDILQFTEDCY